MRPEIDMSHVLGEEVENYASQRGLRKRRAYEELIEAGLKAATVSPETYPMDLGIGDRVVLLDMEDFDWIVPAKVTSMDEKGVTFARSVSDGPTDIFFEVDEDSEIRFETDYRWFIEGEHASEREIYVAHVLR